MTSSDRNSNPLLVVSLAQYALDNKCEQELLLRMSFHKESCLQGGICSIGQVQEIGSTVGIKRSRCFTLLRSMIKMGWATKVRRGVYHFTSLKKIAAKEKLSITRVVEVPFDALFQENKLSDPYGRKISHLTIWKGFLASVLMSRLLQAGYTEKVLAQRSSICSRDKGFHRSGGRTGQVRAVEKCPVSSVDFEFDTNKGLVSNGAIAKILGIGQRAAGRLIQYAANTGLITLQQNYDKRFDEAAADYAKQFPSEGNEYFIKDNGLSLAKAISAHGSIFNQDALCLDLSCMRVRVRYVPVCTTGLVLMKRRVPQWFKKTF